MILSDSNLVVNDAARARGRAAVIGAGPAGLMAAEVLARGGAAVTVYDRMPSAGRKFLLAGRGGLNLTHSEDFERFVGRYGAAAPYLRPALEAFSPAALRTWSEDLGQPIFVGSSGRIFPQSFKASPLLRAWLRRLDGLGVAFRPRCRWIGWTPMGIPLLVTPEGRAEAIADATVLALGGGSWPHLGSDGAWCDAMAEAEIATAALRPSNCGFRVDWSEHFRARFDGHPLKGIALSFGDRTVRGEAIIVRTGLEGGGVYALSGPLRDAVAAHGEAVLKIALRPGLSGGELETRLAARPVKQSMSTFLSKALKLAPAAIGLLQEAAFETAEPLSARSPERLAHLINAVPVRLRGPAPLERAISSAGGVRFEEIDAHFMLRRRPGTFVAGEMLDWEAPTGGYLLQACFATGAAAGEGALGWLDRHRADDAPWASA